MDWLFIRTCVWFQSMLYWQVGNLTWDNKGKCKLMHSARLSLLIWDEKQLPESLGLLSILS